MDNSCSNPDCRCIANVCCDVCDCMHNDEHNRCTADHINVRFAQAGNDAACDTYKAK